jgi:4-amino-4-deoxy-L-arabinose transferase-like glycosyltransferase
MMFRAAAGAAIAALQRLLVRRSAAVAPLSAAALPASMPAAAAPAAGILYALVALLVPAFFFLYGLDAFPLRDNNEGLYAGIAREMLASGEFIVPHLNGVPYIEKPPLLYWLMSLSMSVFGPTPAAARLVPAGAMLALCAGLYHFCRLHGNKRVGCIASVGLASAVPVALLSHVVLFDLLLTALLGGCLLSYLHSYLRRSRRALLLAAFLLALAVLEKGAVALALTGGIVALFLLLMRERDGWRRLLDPAALAVLVAVAAPWHVWAAYRQEGFAWFYFVNEHLLRFLGQRLPDDYHRGPWWFYLPRIPVMLLPWSAFLFLLLPDKGKSEAGQGAPAPILTFCKAAVLFPLLFFSLSQNKAEYYMMVVAPALALWLAVETARRLDNGGTRLAVCWGVSAATALVLVAAAPATGAGKVPATAAWLLGLGWAVMAVALTRWFGRLRTASSREAALLATALAAAPALALLCHAAGERGLRDSSAEVARIIREQPPHAVFIYRHFEDSFSTLPFYLGHTVGLIDSESRDLQFGCRVSARPTCVSGAAFKAARERGPVAVAVHADHADDFLRMAGNHGWRVASAGKKMVYFSTK